MLGSALAFEVVKFPIINAWQITKSIIPYFLFYHALKGIACVSMEPFILASTCLNDL
jgi:hypothetical protein